MSAVPILRVAGYGLTYATPSGPFEALADIDLTIPGGTTVGLVGESGSGKTSLASAIMRYLPPNAVEHAGSIRLAGQELIGMSRREVLDLRGRRIAMVFQDPSTSLNPTLTLGAQIAEVLVRHRKLTRRDARAEAESWLARTGIERPAAMMARYPHQASGGEKQRVVIATAFACNPELIVFDEPTTALDVITARQILDLFTELRAATPVAALYISHDLNLVSRIADDVAVIHRGRIVEHGSAEALFRAPTADYTRALIAAVPRPSERLVRRPPTGESALIRLDGVGVRYGRRSFAERLAGKAGGVIYGAEGIDLSVRPGEILGLVGASGSGKSTLAKALAGIEDYEGTVTLGERSFAGRAALDRAYRRAVQIVFQNPDSSLNPRQTIREILSRPLKLYGTGEQSGGQIGERIEQLLEEVRLPADYARRYPHQLSGGEKQRVAIARAFAAEPELVICDEITSSLDVSVQAAVARLLVALTERTGTACLFITHDLNLVRQLAHRIAVMRGGRLVDLFDVADAEAPERHDYTRALIDAVPAPIAA